jgi:hypothetical protein
MNMTMTPVAITFATVTGIALIGIILVLIFDRPKRPKDRPADEEHAKGASHRL